MYILWGRLLNFAPLRMNYLALGTSLGKFASKQIGLPRTFKYQPLLFLNSVMKGLSYWDLFGVLGL